MLPLLECVDDNWVTVYAMLRRFVILREAWETCFAHVRQVGPDSCDLAAEVLQLELTAEEWNNLQQVLTCLEPVKQTSILLEE